MTDRERRMVQTYDLFVRVPKEGTMAAAMKAHAQACGLVAYIYDEHPDTVARAVADAARA